jgi:hypothetical protein
LIIRPSILIRLRNLRCEEAKVLTRTVEPHDDDDDDDDDDNGGGGGDDETAILKFDDLKCKVLEFGNFISHFVLEVPHQKNKSRAATVTLSD